MEKVKYRRILIDKTEIAGNFEKRKQKRNLESK